MKYFLTLFACVAVASAQLVNYPNGPVAPVEIPEVQAAKAAHFAAKGAPFYNGAALPYAYGAPALNYADPHAYGYNGLQAYPNGAIVPVDEPAVQAAKAEHFAAEGLAYAAPAYAHGPAANYGPALTVHANSVVVPVELVEVQEARPAHLANF
ncbi:hypothetical protein TCAL_09268 [Tigriopus californicus]|uniref:Uncharacterized protein n=1 Tax=Tigriopus californicus TaxID=6832 RepID=A0A553N6Z2_TIGCA|nr:cuticle protein 2-like [Tigriopus californicus]TRY61170.1 hypothetical protein TCAL_09268 [Tigriopus californicus]|eukprot:TCALIF_09268-PA protein Name:"Protein of unknown function" AED:0.04 eAED:0.04 QI:0/0/0/0.5/1/1/2/0/152